MEREGGIDEPGSFYSVRSCILGFGLPLAVGLQTGNPQRRVVCPVGDGSALYSIQALWTAVQRNAPAIFSVLRNHDYSALRGFCDFTSMGQAFRALKFRESTRSRSRRAMDWRPSAWIVPKNWSRPSDRLCRPKAVQKGGQTTFTMDRSVSPPNYG